MNIDIEDKFYCSHGYGLENILSMVACVFGVVVVLHEYHENSQFWLVPIGIFGCLLALFSIDSVITKVLIYADSQYLYVKPTQPFTFKKRFRFKRKNIEKVIVKSEKTVSRYGPIETHTVVLKTKNGEKHNIVVPRDKSEAIRVKKELSRWRYA